MNEREVEVEETKGEVSREVQAGIETRRGGGASLDAGVRERLAPALGDPLTDVRIHTDTGAGTLARAVSARAFATGSDVFFAQGEYQPGSGDGDRLLAHELAHVVQQRGAPISGVMRVSEPGDPWELEADAMAGAALAPRAAPAVARAPAEALLARDFIDDIKGLLGGEQEEAKRVERKEVPVTKQDFEQVLSLVMNPLIAAEQMLAGEADVAKAKSAIGKVVPAGNALMVIAGTKKEPKNRDNLYKPVDELGLALATLQVMAEPDKAKALWKDHFEKAMTKVDEVLALPIRDESSQGQQGSGDQGQAQPAAPAANADETITQRDHDLIQVSLKAQLQTLITTTAGEPYQDWDPKVVGADTSIVAAASAFSTRKLLPVRSRLDAGLAAIRAFAMSLNDQQAEAVSKIQSAQVKLSHAMVSYMDADPSDPNSPNYQPPAQP